MQVNLTGHHVDLTSSMRDYVNSKMERLERHFDIVQDIHVVLSVEKLRHKAEATLHINGGNVFADADKLDRQVKKHKEKMTDHHRSEGSIARDL